MKKTYPSCELLSSFPDLLARRDIPAIAIATPAETHLELARLALLAGKDVFVEKPLTLAEKDAGELIALARKKKSILMVGHLLQYHPAFIKLKELAFCGDLGRINYIYSHRLNLGKIRREENILWSFAPHDISMILALAGEEPESVLATGGNYLHKKIADVTTTHLEFSSGLKAHIFVSWLHPFKDQKLVVVGDRKMAVFDDTLPWEEKLLSYPHHVTWENNVPGAHPRHTGKSFSSLCRALEDRVRAFSVLPEEQKTGPDGRRRRLARLESLKCCGTVIKGKWIKNPFENDPSSGVKENYYIHPTAQIDDERGNRGRSKNLAFFPYISRIENRRELLDRTKCGYRTGCNRGPGMQNSKQCFSL